MVNVQKAMNDTKNIKNMVIDKRLRENLDTYIETPWTLIESNFEGH